MSDKYDSFGCLYWIILRDEQREIEWERGIHYDRKGKKHKIEEMDDSHLLNVIKYFDNLDTKPLVYEAKKRGIL